MNKGFTLLELLVVISIIGAFSAFAVIGLSSARKTSNDTRRKSDIKQYQNTLEIYASKNNSRYPQHTTSVAISSSNLCSSTELNLNPCVEDPSGGAHSYQYQSNGSATKYVLWVLLEKPVDPSDDNYFVLCSNGNGGIALGADMPPVGGDCPPVN